MKNSRLGIIHRWVNTTSRVVILALVSISTTQVFGQAPGLLWTASTGGKLFGVDAQAAYVSAGTNVIKLNLLTGEALQTNSLCPLPGVARLDASGNYYFAGNFDGTQNFGGITLVGGWTNWPTPGHWMAGYPTHFVAKYNSAGVLQWVKSFGKQANNANQLTDLEVDSIGGVFVGHSFVESPGIATASITRFDSGGNLQWTVNVGAGTNVKLGNIVNTNLYYLNCGGSYLYVVAGRVDFNGSKLGYTPGPSFQIYASAATSNGKPAADDGQRLFVSGTPTGSNCSVNSTRAALWCGRKMSITENNGRWRAMLPNAFILVRHRMY